jgi:4-amino-4-deoxy-L-arabinose transferase-like glycosyltransferase
MLSRAATPDAVLIFPMTLAIAIYVVAVTGKTSGSRMSVDYPSDRRVLVLMYGVMGLAVLAKGPLGLILPTAIIGMFLLVRRLPERSRGAVSSSQVITWGGACLRPFHPMHFLKTCLAMKPVTATLACLAVALPWYVVVTLRTDGAWTRGFFLDHNVGRFAQSMEHHGGPIIYYPLVMCAGFFPWSVFFIPLGLELARRLKQPDDAHASRVFCLCWVGVVVGLFSLAGTKLPSYVAPCYPGLALLMADFAVRLAEGNLSLRAFWPRFSFGTLTVVGVALTVGLVFVARHFSPGDEVVAIVGLPLIAGGVLCWMLLRSRPQVAVATFAVTALVFTAGLLGPAAARIGQRQQIASLMNVVNSLSTAPELHAAGAFRSSWVFYAGHPVREDDVSRVSPFLAEDVDHFAITTRADLDALKTPLPAGVGVLAEIPFFTRPDKMLVLLGRAGPREQAVTRSTDTSESRTR